MQPNDLIEQVKASGLRGRGGAGFPTGLKWQFVLKDTPKPKYICCNADESEPGTFKDHVLMERNPHLLIEGCAISLLRHRRQGRLHLHPRRVLPRAGDPRGRDREGLQGRLPGQEHPRQRLRLRRLRAPRRRRLRSRRGDGAHRVARRQARAAAASSRRSRRSPGLYQCPTAVNNVETLCNVPPIVLNGAEWFAAHGAGEERRPEALLHQRPREAPGRLRGVDAHDAARADLRRASTRRACAAAASSRRSSPAARRCRCCSTSTSTRRPASTTSRRPGRCSARPA